MKTNFMDRVSHYKNINLAYHRVKNSSMNKELYIEQEEQVFSQCIPEVYTYIKEIITGGIAFDFSFYEQFNKPKNHLYLDNVNSDQEIRPLNRISFLESVIIQSFMNVLAEEIKLLLPRENYAYRVLDSEALYFYEFWQAGYARYVKAELDAIDSKSFNCVIESDIEKFYDSVNKEKLLEALGNYLNTEVDGNKDVKEFLRWIEKILSIPVKINGDFQPLLGLPQGPLHSPLLALFYIRSCFTKVRRRFPGINCFAYVDDLRVYCENTEQANKVLEELDEFFNKLNLRLNPEKTNIFEIDNSKTKEARIMSKASSLNRAIRDDVLFSDDGKNQMKERLNSLIKEAKEIVQLDDMKKEKFIGRIHRFVGYRLVKLTKILDSKDDWYQQLENPILDSNFTSIWHALFLSARLTKQKRALILYFQRIAKLFNNNESNNYVIYLAVQYLFRWSPQEILLSEEEIEDLINKFLGTDSKEFIQKAILAKAHRDWYPYFRDKAKFNLNTDDQQLQILLVSLKLYDQLPYPYTCEPSKKLITTVNELRFCYFNIELDDVGFLDSEVFKSINYVKMNRVQSNWQADLDENAISFDEVMSLASEVVSKDILTKIFKWVSIQLSFEDKRLPHSVVNPSYIWVDQKRDKLYLYGNPGLENDILFDKTPSWVWKKSLIQLFMSAFKLNRRNVVSDMSFIDGNESPLKFWQYRILRLLSSKRFSIDKFIERVVIILQEETSSCPVNFDQFHMDKLISHYIDDPYVHDQLIVIKKFVEDSWLNGSKDCYFYTIHNHDHGRYLIYKIHEIVEKSGFGIYLNRKEAFRLFSACFLHDIGMLADPSDDYVADCSPKHVRSLSNGITDILHDVASKVNRLTSNNLLRFSFKIHKEVEVFRENIVRELHPSISQQELLGDYPKLPLTVAERRDVGVLSLAHGMNKKEVKNIANIVYDNKHRIRLRFLSLLLRISDLCDVSKDRVRKEVLERNYKRMSDISIFHWIKHLSVDDLLITYSESKDAMIVQLEIVHNYLPRGNFTVHELKQRCGSNCKIDYKEKGLKDYFHQGLQWVPETNTDFKYFERSQCNITCAFINEAYRSFYSEIININRYLNNDGISVQLDLCIKHADKHRGDFEYVTNRNLQRTAQEFMFSYFR